jgi:Protein of unknown function (DUF2442)
MTKTKTPAWVESELARLDEVGKRSIHREVQKPRHAVAARFDTLTHKIVVELDNGADFSFPPNLAQGLRGYSDADLQQIEISPLGTGLHWPTLDADLTVDGLLAGVFGNRYWMRELAMNAAKAGATKSPAKSAAARANGSLGGRPRKTPVSA